MLMTSVCLNSNLDDSSSVISNVSQRVADSPMEIRSALELDGHNLSSVMNISAMNSGIFSIERVLLHLASVTEIR